MLGKEAYNKLKDSHVLIVGLGAVGGYAAEALARSGVGRFTIVDFDKVSLSNINRQLYALSSTVGEYKTEICEVRIRDINPDVIINKKRIYVSSENINELFDLCDFDLLIDAIDSLTSKIDLLTAASLRSLKVYSSMGAALRTDFTKVKAADIYDTKYCPLARVVRKGLKRKKVGRGITCVYSTEQSDFKYLPPEEEEYQEEAPTEASSRRLLGSMPTLTGIFGLMLANMAILYLSGDHRKDKK